MDIYQIEYVLAVAKYQHFTRAADEICVSQSALSHQINKLEEELGVQLFKRTTRAVSLTPAGREFVANVTEIMVHINKTKCAMRQHALAERGEIIIGGIPTIGLLGFAADIASFQNMHPNLQVSIQEDFSSGLLDMLHNAAIDVALMTPPANNEQNTDLTFYPLIVDEIVLVTHPEHPLATRKSIELHEAKAENYIFMKPNNGLREITMDACHNAGFEPNIVYQSGQVETVLALVASGLGITLITSRIADFLKNLPYKIVRLQHAPKRVTALAVPQHNYQSPATKLFCAFLLDRYHVV